MKNFLMCALILCAIPAVAFGQTVTCDDCTHDVSVYMGSGGLVAETDADEVVFVATCDGVTTSGKWMPNDDGVVIRPFNDDNGLSCHSDKEGNRLQLGPVMDGGWFYINDEMNSAVGNLVNHDILDNEMTEIADAGDSVTTTMGKGAVYLKHTNGRVGILPTILPVEPPAATAMCGPTQSRSWPYAWTGQKTSNCMLGDGGTKVRLQGPAAHGRTGTISGGMVTRPATGAPLMVTADLWVNESGSYSTDMSNDGGPTAAAIQKGWAGKTASAAGAGAGNNWLTDVVWSVHLHGGGPLADATGAGVTIADDDGQGNYDGQATISIASSTSYCPAQGAQTSATVIIAAAPATATTTPAAGETGENMIHPSLRTFGRGNAPAAVLVGRHAGAQLTIMCPPRSAANQGTDLVPENPFPPTTE